MNSTTASCAVCGSGLAPGAAAGVCPQCEFATALDDRSGETALSLNGIPVADRRLDDYELIEEIAQGGMGVVYKARHLKLKRIVALKMILSGQFANREQVMRFRAEAEAAATLRHPNIVTIYETGEFDGQPYFTMDYIEGHNLSELVQGATLPPPSVQAQSLSAADTVSIEQSHLGAASLLRATGARGSAGPLPIRRAAEYLRKIAGAVHHAHEHGILHRDIKPSNILVDVHDEPRLTDFGLAKRMQRESFVTVTGQVLGSPNFMPPEQADPSLGKGDRTSDVYGLGAVLYYTITGRPAFTAEGLSELLNQVLHADVPSPRLLNPSVPEDLETICLKCLEKEPGKRYSTAKQLAEELTRFLNDEPIHARPLGPTGRVLRWARRKPALAGALAIAVGLLFTLAVGSTVAAYRINEARRAADAEALRAHRNEYAADMLVAYQALSEKNLGRARELLEKYGRSQESEVRSQPSALSDPASGIGYRGSADRRSNSILTPDSRLLAPDLRSWEWRYLWEQTRSDHTKILRGHDAPVRWAEFSPDGRRLATDSRFEHALKLWDVESGRELKTLSLPTNQDAGVCFSPNGRFLAVGDGSELHILDPMTLQPLRLPINFTNWLTGLTVDPVGQRLAVMAGRELVVLDGASWTEISRDTLGSSWSLAWSPDGKTLAIATQREAVLLWNVESRRITSRLPLTRIDHSLAENGERKVQLR